MKKKYDFECTTFKLLQLRDIRDRSIFMGIRDREMRSGRCHDYTVAPLILAFQIVQEPVPG